MHGKREFLLNFIESQTILCGIVSENSFVKIIENPGVEWRFLFPYFSHFRSCLQFGCRKWPFFRKKSVFRISEKRCLRKMKI